MVSRSEIDLLDIRAEYKRLYGKSLYHDITVRGPGATWAGSWRPTHLCPGFTLPSLEQPGAWALSHTWHLVAGPQTCSFNSHLFMQLPLDDL